VMKLGGQADGVVLLVSTVEIRPLLRRLVQLKFPELAVVSRADLDPSVPVEVVSEIRFELAANEVQL